MTYLAQPVLVAEDRDDHPGPEAPGESGYAGGRAVPPGHRGEEQAESGEAEDTGGRDLGTPGAGATSSPPLPVFFTFFPCPSFLPSFLP